MTALIDGAGTLESQWREWLDARSWSDLDIEAVAGRRIVALSAHPDDETLGAAGLLCRLAALGCPLVFVWATDGEASHPGSTVFTARQLASRRRDEASAALDVLGIHPDETHHLGLPDSRLAGHTRQLRAALGALVRMDDVVVAPWAHDGHPDHDAVGQTAAALGVTCWQYPIWMWHWAGPADPRIPWQRLRRVQVPDPALKAAAIKQFTTQVRPIGGGPQDAAILPPHVVARFQRPTEWIVT